ncbi:MAG: hypothetical protein GXP19_04955 [Gammaproteobacteria bacterium]|nr:hypothetical protein [Gammaproteobacteria bacterium]
MSVESNTNTANLDQETTAEVRRVITGMQDALTDEMVSRIAATVSDSAGLLDQLARSGVDKAIPTLARLVENGDLERIAQLARVVGAMQDAVTDEMITRLTDVISQTLSLFERINKAGLDNLLMMLPQMIKLFEHVEQNHVVYDLVDCLNKATEQAEIQPSSRGGLKGLWEIAREPDTQDVIQFLLLVSKQFRACRIGRQIPQNKP